MNKEGIKFYEKLVKCTDEDKAETNEAQEYLLECLEALNKNKDLCNYCM